MTTKKNTLALFLGLTIGISLVAGGCGKSPPPVSTAKIAERAEQALQEADVCIRDKSFAGADFALERAAKAAAEGKSVASTSAGKKQFQDISERIVVARNELRIKREESDRLHNRSRASEEVADAASKLIKKAEKSDEVETVKAAEEEKRKQAEAERRRQQIDAAQKEDVKIAAVPKNSNEDPPPPEELVEKVDAPKKEDVPAAVPSEPVTVLQVKSLGKEAFALVRIYNSDTKAKAIGRVDGDFKDAGNGILFPSIAAYEYAKFKQNVKNIYDDQPVDAAIVGDTHRIPAGKTMDVVFIGDIDPPERAGRVAKFTARVMYSDNTEQSGTGPSAAPAGGGRIKID
jgi:hypothetical protein